MAGDRPTQGGWGPGIFYFALFPTNPLPDAPPPSLGRRNDAGTGFVGKRAARLARVEMRGRDGSTSFTEFWNGITSELA